MKILKLALVSALAAISFNSANAAVLLTYEDTADYTKTSPFTVSVTEYEYLNQPALRFLFQSNGSQLTSPLYVQSFNVPVTIETYDINPTVVDLNNPGSTLKLPDNLVFFNSDPNLQVALTWSLGLRNQDERFTLGVSDTLDIAIVGWTMDNLRLKSKSEDYYKLQYDAASGRDINTYMGGDDWVYYEHIFFTGTRLDSREPLNVAIPEPSTALLGLISLVGLVRRKR